MEQKTFKNKLAFFQQWYTAMVTVQEGRLIAIDAHSWTKVCELDAHREPKGVQNQNHGAAWHRSSIFYKSHILSVKNMSTNTSILVLTMLLKEKSILNQISIYYIAPPSTMDIHNIKPLDTFWLP